MKFSHAPTNKNRDDFMQTMEHFVVYMKVVAAHRTDEMDRKLASAYATIVSTTISTLKQIEEV